MPCLSLFCFMVFGPPGVALSGAAPVAPAPSVQAYGRDGRCLAWTDGCRICMRVGDASQCSTPGIACTPSAITCTRPAD